MPTESSATTARDTEHWCGGGGTKASSGGRGPRYFREATTIPLDDSRSSTTRTPYLDRTTFLKMTNVAVNFKVTKLTFNLRSRKFLLNYCPEVIDTKVEGKVVSRYIFVKCNLSLINSHLVLEKSEWRLTGSEMVREPDGSGHD